MRTLATFHSEAFNTSEPRPHYINPTCYGDDLAAWLQERLEAGGTPTRGEPGQEDFGWYVRYVAGGVRYCFVMGYRPGSGGEAGTWIGWVERDRGLIGSLLGRRSRGIGPDGVRAVHDVLSGAIEVEDLRWHEREDFDRGREEEGRAEP